uniref:Uncharacterized protein n=1 Tax=Candidatus Kentrum sp. LFY TaxID=2126342 RepID=A0A450WD71_9GAMM|nr:MAG: hypothetical protein BECKLFY1418C_GA0070996_10121 [Candidatus Kentron sp. LFY]
MREIFVERPGESSKGIFANPEINRFYLGKAACRIRAAPA